MTAATEDWSRPAFEPGGGDASLFYLAFGELAAVRFPPTPAFLSITVHPQGESRRWVDALVAAARDDAEDSPGLTALVRAAPDFAVIRGHRADPPDLVHLRDAECVLAALLEAGAVALLDVEAQRWWTPDLFRSEVLAALRPSIRAHVSVRARRGLVEARGLRKVGRPDLRVHRVPAGSEDRAADLCWSLAERLVRGARPGPGLSAGVLRLRPSGAPGHPALEAEWPDLPFPRVRIA
jgi:hypothetical protein